MENLLKTNIIVTKRAGPKTNNKTSKLLINKTLGLNNRSVALRIPTGDPLNTRIEHRMSGAEANSYLASEKHP